jgi:methylglutaconyl-CoA hydratase
LTGDGGVAGITLRQEGVVVIATLNAPDGNLMSLAMCDALRHVLLEPPTGAHVLLLEAQGESFCLGRERTAVAVDTLAGEVSRLLELNRACAATPLVTVSRVNGDAAGFGVGLAALADVAVAVESALFSFPEVRLGLAPTLVLAWLRDMVGRRNAFWLTATGEEFAASEARDLGLLNEVVPDEAALDAAVQRRLETLTRSSPRVHAEIRSMLRVTAGLDPDTSYEIAGDRLVVGSLRRAMG